MPNTLAVQFMSSRLPFKFTLFTTSIQMQEGTIDSNIKNLSMLYSFTDFKALVMPFLRLLIVAKLKI
jgi:hypothetical protein